MKKTLLLICATALLTGCVRYDITLRNETKITNVPYPKLDKARQEYIVDTGGGNTRIVRASAVKLIEPHQKESEAKFKVQ